MSAMIANLFYLLASVLFITGLKGLTHPRTAPRGNLLGAAGMLIAVATVLVSEVGLHWGYILAGVMIGAVVGAALAIKIQMTAMPQLVAVFNGFGGGASLLVAAVPFITSIAGATLDVKTIIAASVSAVIQ